MRGAQRDEVVQGHDAGKPTLSQWGPITRPVGSKGPQERNGAGT